MDVAATAGARPTRIAEFGAHLRSEREARSMRVDEISASTKIPVRVLLSLEQGRLEDLPSRVYVRGFVKAYARALGVSAEDLLGRLEDATRVDDEVRVESLAERVRAVPREWWAPRTLGVAIGLALVALIVMAFTLVARRSEASRSSQSGAGDPGSSSRSPARRDG